MRCAGSLPEHEPAAILQARIGCFFRNEAKDNFF
jgi:hypothetical protein